MIYDMLQWLSLYLWPQAGLFSPGLSDNSKGIA